SVLDLVVGRHQLLPQHERLADALEDGVTVLLQYLVAYPATAEVLRHFGSGADAAEGVEDELAGVGVEADEAVRDLLGEGAGMVQLPRWDGRDVPDVVGDLAGEDAVEREAVTLLLFAAALLIDPPRAGPAEDQDVLGHDVWVVVAGKRVLDDAAGA